MVTTGKPKFLGFATGAVAGLVVITPGCGFVSNLSAAIIGSLAGVVCYLAIHIKNKSQSHNDQRQATMAIKVDSSP